MSGRGKYPVTPDGHYFLVRGRLGRCTNPKLSPATRQEHVRALMAGRRAVRAATEAGDTAALRAARQQVQNAKVGLGERGPPWWGQDAATFDRRLARNTPYRAWAQALAPKSP